MPEKEECMGITPNCQEKISWYRITQFSGTHTFCEKCAKLEKDFGKEDLSYFFWLSHKDYHSKPKKK